MVTQLLPVEGKENTSAFRYGFIDRTGQEVIPCQYAGVYDFDQGLALVKLENKQALIDKTGREIIPFSDEIYQVENGLIKDTKRSVRAV